MKGIKLTRRLSRRSVLTNMSGSRCIPTQQPLTKIFVAWGITAGEISYIQNENLNVKLVKKTKENIYQS